MVETIFFEDFEPGERIESGSHCLDKAEMVAFATEWDPLPAHIDEAAGRAAFGSLTASGVYLLAVKQRLLAASPLSWRSVMASFGYDELRFHKPARPGDTLTLVMECVEKRASRSRPEAGIVTVRLALVNQDDEVVMSHLDTVLLRKRQPP
jgi:acyl dehydratase